MTDVVMMIHISEFQATAEIMLFVCCSVSNLRSLESYTDVDHTCILARKRARAIACRISKRSTVHPHVLERALIENRTGRDTERTRILSAVSQNSN